MSAKLRGLSLVAALSLLTAATGAQAQMEENVNNPVGNDTTPGAGAMAMDAIVVRPLSLAGTMLGAVVFVVGLPFEALAGNVSDPARRLVVEPAKYTFRRPLGEDIEGHNQ